MLTLLIGKIDKVHTTCGHPDGLTIRESIMDGGYESVRQALEENAEILFEENATMGSYLIIRGEHNNIVATGRWWGRSLHVTDFYSHYFMSSGSIKVEVF